jgi:RNA polymerase sigma factor (TIGR02999 family)
MAEPGSTVESLLTAWSAGDSSAVDSLFTLLYQDLRRIAGQAIDARHRNGALQPTELLNEAYLRLSRAANLKLEDRTHFLALACRAMRMVVVDAVRAANRDKRGGGVLFVTIGSANEPGQTCDPASFLDLDAALTRLFELDPTQARIVELHYFAGLNYVEIAGEMGLSESTVNRNLRMAKAWLATQLSSRQSV